MTSGKQKIVLDDIQQERSLLSLRLLQKSDSINVCRWMSSSYILQNSFVVPGVKSLPHDFATQDYAERYFNTLITDVKRLSFAIMYDERHIGNIGLKDICDETLTAECFIEIGEPQFRDRGLGESAMIALLNLAFKQRGLEAIYLDVLEFNFQALKLYRRLGFSPSGHITWHYDEFGQHWRVLNMFLANKIWLAR